MDIIKIKILQTNNMKQLISTFSFIILGCALYAQNVSFTIKPSAGVDSKAKVYVRSNAAKTGIVSQVLVTFLLPATIVPTPTATFAPTGTFAHLGAYTPLDVNQQIVNGINYVVYTFFNVYTGTTSSNMVENTEYELGEVTFNYGGFITSELRLAYLPGGGSNALSGLAFELGGNQIGNEASIVYGPVASNAGNSSGFSFVGINVVLPVDFKSFYALKSGDDAKLTWDVSSDEKNNYFEVLRSADGRNFKTIQRVNALGNGRSENSYQADDLSLSKLGTREVFYQIQQFDKDGQNIKSPVRKLSIDGLGKSVTAFPNPARTTTKVVVDAPEAGKGSLIMRDAAGRQVQVVNAQFNRGINQFDMNVMSLSSGEYNIQVQGGGLNETIKVTKIN